MTSNRKAKRRRPTVKHRSSNRAGWIVATAAAAALGAAGWALTSTGSTRASGVQAEPLTVQSLRVDIVRELPHDTTAYTQGLLWRDGWLFESTGQYGDSRLRRIDPESGAVVQEVYTSPAFFGEGLAAVGDQLIMLTWKAERAFVYDVASLEQVRTFRYRGEGWGLCHDNGRSRLIMSNGSDTLTIRDPTTFEPRDSVRVTLRGRPVTQLNELACVAGVVYANVYQEDYLVVIDLETGRVTHQIDAAGLLTAEEARGVDVLNGIAYDPDADTFYITGKDWPKMFEVRFVE